MTHASEVKAAELKEEKADRAAVKAEEIQVEAEAKAERVEVRRQKAEDAAKRHLYRVMYHVRPFSKPGAPHLPPSNPSTVRFVVASSEAAAAEALRELLDLDPKASLMEVEAEQPVHADVIVAKE